MSANVAESGLSTLGNQQMLSMDDALELMVNFDPARMQTLLEEAQGEDIAFSSLLDEDGTVLFSDQLGLIGETAVIPLDTALTTETWREEEIWVITTPLEQEDETIGAWQVGLRLDAVEAFLDESRSLFQLTGVIAILAGVLIAQAIGNAVTVPVRRLTAVTRQLSTGDLNVQFEVNSRDELAALAGAFNDMVIGLREREWLRDMFGRFVSQEVAEAMSTGQVKLTGENRVVSVLFCDIRGFTKRSEQHTPQKIVAL
ncbi:MAG: HAMP domain-containing protein, partial [Planctomycetaceae bacterium]|nr:HAMP domain-containing protein [Planctomycetaceae bacterium]